MPSNEATKTRFSNFKEGKVHFVTGNKVEPINIHVPPGYSPDLDDKYYRHEEVKLSNGEVIKLPDNEFHMLTKAEHADSIAAKFNRNYFNDPENAGENDVTGNLKKPDSPQRVLCKRYDLSKLGAIANGYTRVRREVQLCRIHDHPQIVAFHEVFLEGPEKRHLWLVSERMDFSLRVYYGVLRKEQEFVNVGNLKSVLVQILRALDYLHQKGIIHRNLNPTNIGVNQSDLTVKLLDFALAREANTDKEHSKNVNAMPIYKAIEVLMGTQYDSKADIWAAALVALEMCDVQLFLPSQQLVDQLVNLGKEKVVLHRICDVLGVPYGRYKSILGCEVDHPNCGPTIENELRNACQRLSGGADEDAFCELMQKMLLPDQEARLSAHQCINEDFLKETEANYRNINPKTSEELSKQDLEILKEIESRFSELAQIKP